MRWQSKMFSCMYVGYTHINHCCLHLWSRVTWLRQGHAILHKTRFTNTVKAKAHDHCSLYDMKQMKQKKTINYLGS